MLISVIIPTYKEPEVLDLCIRSAIEGQVNQNEIIVVVDGFFEMNRSVLEKYADHISVLDLGTNHGLSKATNLGVYNCTNNLVLIVNDDNVFPLDWDTRLIESYSDGCVLSPNQIEPTPSMFRQFIIKDLGRSPSTFDLNKFQLESQTLSEPLSDFTGCTLPIAISKKDYMRVGGWDESYPGAWVVDWDFFLKCELSGLQMKRTYYCNFYHFVSLGTEYSESDRQDKMTKEIDCHRYFEYKWGERAAHNPINNSKLLNKFGGVGKTS